MILEIISWIGSGLLILAYFLLATNKIKQNSWKYHVLNLIGSIIFIIFSVYKYAYSSAFVNIVFSTIAIYSLIKIYRSWKLKK